MRLKQYITESIRGAFFISPKGEIISTPQTHIQQVVTNPKKFGFDDGIIDHIYDFYNEPKGQEGKAREQILVSLLNQGWIRLRRSRNFWTAQLQKLDMKSKKNLSKWAGALLDGKLGFKELDPYVELKILDTEKLVSSSDLQQLRAMSEGVDIADVSLCEMTDLDDMPILAEYRTLAEGSYDYKKLKANRKQLEPGERDQVMKAGAVWHNHPNPKYNPVPAVWKTSDQTGNTKYCCNTHRAIQIKDTLQGAIKAFDFIKTTA
jgi:hypothetical protein